MIYSAPSVQSDAQYNAWSVSVHQQWRHTGVKQHILVAELLTSCHLANPLNILIVAAQYLFQIGAQIQN